MVDVEAWAWSRHTGVGGPRRSTTPTPTSYQHSTQYTLVIFSPGPPEKTLSCKHHIDDTLITTVMTIPNNKNIQTYDD